MPAIVAAHYAAERGTNKSAFCATHASAIHTAIHPAFDAAECEANFAAHITAFGSAIETAVGATLLDAKRATLRPADVPPNCEAVCAAF